MIRRALASLLFALLALPLHADFSDVARAIDRHAGVKRVWTPLFGIARVFVRAIQPEGIYDFQLATFEGAGEVDPRGLRRIVDREVGPGFTPLVQVWSRASGEWSFIYAKPSKDGSRIELMVLAHDAEETVLVRVDVDADIVARELGDPRKVTRVARR